MENSKEKYERIAKELEEKERQWIANCRSSYPAWSKPMRENYHFIVVRNPEERIRKTARRGLANWMWCCILCYAWVLFAMYLKYGR